MAGKQKKRIFIVEDEGFSINFYKNRLTAAGYEVGMTPQVSEAMRLIKDFKPNLVIVDLMLKDGNGFDLISEIRSTKGFKKLPVIVLSNLGQDSDIDEAKKRGANKYFVKSDTKFQDIEDVIAKMV